MWSTLQTYWSGTGSASNDSAPPTGRASRRPAPIHTNSHTSTSHHDTVPMFFVPTPPPHSSNSGTVTSSDLLPCQYSQYGCDALLTVATLDSHLTYECEMHLQLLLSSYRILSAKYSHTQVALAHSQTRSRKTEEKLFSMQNENESLRAQLVQYQAQPSLQTLLSAVNDKNTVIRAKDQRITALQQRVRELENELSAVKFSLDNSAVNCDAEGLPNPSPSPSLVSYKRGLLHPSPLLRAASPALGGRNGASPYHRPIPLRAASASPLITALVQPQSSMTVTPTKVFLTTSRILTHGLPPTVMGKLIDFADRELPTLPIREEREGEDNDSDIGNDSEKEIDTVRYNESVDIDGYRSRWPRALRRPGPGEQSIAGSLGLENFCPAMLAKKAAHVIGKPFEASADTANGKAKQGENSPVEQ